MKMKRTGIALLLAAAVVLLSTQGAMAEYLARFRASHFYDDVKAQTKRLLPKLPLLGKPVFDMIAHLKEALHSLQANHESFLAAA